MTALHDDEVRFTIFIPTYNRAHLLPRALRSIEKQSITDFEVVIVDDGSTDNTADVVKKWQETVSFPVTYQYQENQGKPSAHNAGVALANSFFFVTLDSDDELTPDALEILDRYWNGIPDEKKPYFVGIEGLCRHLENNDVVGVPFPKDIFDSNYPEMRYQYNIHGDKKNAIRTEIAKKYTYPIFPGENHIRMSIIWDRMSKDYKFRYINETIQVVEYQPGGLTTGALMRRLNNVKSYQLVYQEAINTTSQYYPFGLLFNGMTKYVRFSLHCGISLCQQRENINHKWLWYAALPKGYINYVFDKRKLKRSKKAKNLR